MSSAARMVMVVDDDESIRDTLREVLEMEGYQVTTAANGRDALSRLAYGEPPSVILLDLMMPVMNGWEFFQHKQEDPRLRSIPVVIVTAARSDDAAASELLRVVPKPLRIEHLLDVLSETC